MLRSSQNAGDVLTDDCSLHGKGGQRLRRAFGERPQGIRETASLAYGESAAPVIAAKKLEGHDELWQARVNRGWRFYFKIEGDEYAIIGIVPHPK